MFASKLLSHGSTELDYQKSIKKCERKSVFGLFENLNISFSTGSAKKPTLYNWLFLSAIYYPKNDNKPLSETSTRTVTLL